ncbi:hypothetical protein [uncultured Fibrella sp.]|uniref:hypothetical protein n=1 Tax=uncultured Fibrella sp. TaxID=1284596 RepID=UPI0035CBCB14
MKKNIPLGVSRLMAVILIAIVSFGLTFFRLESDGPDLVINRSINKPVKPDIYLPKQQKIADISPLMAQSRIGKELKLIAIGGKLMAGYRDGGLYRQSQLTAFPNLLAQQMGIQNFKSPLFDPVEGNGTGYLILDSTEQLLSWQKITNNIGTLSNKPYRLKKFKGGIPDNLSFPELNLNIKSFENESFPTPAYPQRYEFISYYYRILSESEEGQKSLNDILKNIDADIALYHEGYDLYLGLAQFPRNISIEAGGLFSSFNPNIAYRNVKQLIQKGTKVVLFTVPQVVNFPFLHIHSSGELLRKVKTIYARSHNNHSIPNQLDERALFLPTNNVRSLVLGSSKIGLSRNQPLMDEDVITPEEIASLKSVTMYNELYVRQLAKLYNLPIVDLEEIYQRILAGQYYTEDGLYINPSFPSGNFFSADGMNPSGVGQAVIANETIKVMNAHYHIDIPLIEIKKWAALLK